MQELDIIPKAALDYIKRKNLKVGFSYKDVWREEHAAAFTVAKAMQLDVLSDMHNAVAKAVEKGQSFETFKKNIAPALQQKGWWGRKKMTDPLTGKTVNAQMGSDRRLKTIYNVNMRSAFQKGQYDAAMASDLHPYLMYRIGPSVKHREDHQSWDGLILPKNDPFWDSHFPPNGWGCKCYTRAITEARKKQYEKDGVPVPPGPDGSGGGRLQVKTQAPPVTYKTYFNGRKGTVEKVPDGVDPAFNWNQGKAARDAGAKAALENAERKYAEAVGKVEKVSGKKPKMDGGARETTQFHSPPSVDELWKQKKDFELQAMMGDNEELLERARDADKIYKEALQLEEQASRLRESEPAIQVIREQEKEIQNKDYEVAVIVDRNGKVIGTYSNEEEDVVSVPTDELRDNTMTHNHPSGKTFSPEDIEGFVDSFSYEARATTPAMTFSIRRKSDNSIIPRMKHEFNIEYDKAVNEAINKASIYAKRGATEDMARKMYTEKYNETYNEIINIWLAKNAEKYDYIYSVENRTRR